jgi:hypothetical protein
VNDALLRFRGAAAALLLKGSAFLSGVKSLNREKDYNYFGFKFF